MRPLHFVYQTCFYSMVFISAGWCQGLFENAKAGDGGTDNSTFDLGGYVRAGIYSGSAENEDPEVKAGNGLVSLKLEANKPGLGKAFADIRLQAGFLNRENSYSVDVREAWVQTGAGPFSIQAGQQIIVWGRADGINPTNNITPSDITVFSSETDDCRLSNFLINANLQISKIRFEAIWVPAYKSDALPIDLVSLPSGIVIGATNYPDFDVANGSYALRLNLGFPAVDGSVSYFSGYETQPAFDYALTRSSFTLFPTAYRIHAVGGDLSSTIGSFGIRGEAAFKVTENDYEKTLYLPNPQLQYVFGIDKSFMEFEFLVQYSGKTILDFEKLQEPTVTSEPNTAQMAAFQQALALYQMRTLNRMFVEQLDEVSHTVMIRVSRSLFHETLKPEIAAAYNFTTEEYMLRPCISYDITDALVVTTGGQYMDGPEESLYALISNPLSYAFAELKLSF